MLEKCTCSEAPLETFGRIEVVVMQQDTLDGCSSQGTNGAIDFQSIVDSQLDALKVELVREHTRIVQNLSRTSSSSRIRWSLEAKDKLRVPEVEAERRTEDVQAHSSESEQLFSARPKLVQLDPVAGQLAKHKQPKGRARPSLEGFSGTKSERERGVSFDSRECNAPAMGSTKSERERAVSFEVMAGVLDLDALVCDAEEEDAKVAEELTHSRTTAGEVSAEVAVARSLRASSDMSGVSDGGEIRHFDSMANSLCPVRSIRSDSRLAQATGSTTRGSVRMSLHEMPIALREHWDLDEVDLVRASDEGFGGMSTKVDEVNAHEVRVEREMRSMHTRSSLRASRTSVGDRVSLRGSEGVGSIGSVSMWESSQSESTCCDRCQVSFPMNPHCRRRLLWNMGCLAFVLTDAVTIPLLLMVLPQTTLSHELDVISNVFWSCDIVGAFFTAVYINSELSFRYSTISSRYLRTWFVPDMLIVMSEWISLTVQANRTGSWTIFRVLKGCRVLRLVRAVKVESILREQLKRVNSQVLLHMLYLVELVFGFIILNHWMACMWFYLGETMQTVYGHGWFEERQVDASASPYSTGYVLALHWSVANFHGGTDVVPGNKIERIVALISLILGMLIFSFFVSVSTDIIIAVRHSRKKMIETMEAIHRFFDRHTVSPNLVVGVKRYLARNEQYDWVEDRELLKPLPLQLRKAVLTEARAASVEKHPFFLWMGSIHTTAFRDVCHMGFTSSLNFSGEAVFEMSDAIENMFFVESGTLKYTLMEFNHSLRAPSIRVHSSIVGTPRDTITNGRFGAEKLTKRDWICEPALWIQGWQTRGRLLALTNSIMISLDVAHFAQVLRAYAMTHYEACLYARVVMRELHERPKAEISDTWKLTWTGSRTMASEIRPSSVGTYSERFSVFASNSVEARRSFF